LNKKKRKGKERKRKRKKKKKKLFARTKFLSSVFEKTGFWGKEGPNGGTFSLVQTFNLFTINF